jgi:predicted ester cyclase
MSEHSKQIVRRYFEELDRTKASPIDLIAPGFTFQAAGFPPMDLEATKEFTELFFSAFPDLKHPVDELIAEGDTVAFRCRYEGTHTGEDFMGVAATGRHFSAVGAGVVRVLDGKVAEFWVSPDRMTIMQQIGALPAEDE